MYHRSPLMEGTRFQPVLDKRFRVTHFTHPEYPGEEIDPITAGKMSQEESIPEELLPLHGFFSLTYDGNVIHRGVDVPDNVNLGHGVLLGAKTYFAKSKQNTSVGDNTSIIGTLGTEIGSGVEIGNHASIRANEIKDGVVIGQHVLAMGGVIIQSGAVIGESVKIHENARIGANAQLHRAARIGIAQVIPPGATVVARAKIGNIGGSYWGDGYSPQGGAFIRPGEVVREDRIR